MGKKWRTWKGILKSRGYDPSLSVDEIVKQQTSNDNRVSATQLKELVTRWFTPEFQAMKNDGVYPTRGEMYIITRTHKDGSYVDDEAPRVVSSLKAIAIDSTSTPGDLDDFTIDDYSKVKGPEKRGYVGLVGRMPATKSNGNSLNNSQIIHQLQSAVNAMMTLSKNISPMQTCLQYLVI